MLEGRFSFHILIETDEPSKMMQVSLGYFSSNVVFAQI